MEVHLPRKEYMQKIVLNFEIFYSIFAINGSKKELLLN